MKKFVILGSSSGLPQADRASSGYVLKIGESLSLFDCGGGVTQSFLKRGFDPLKVDKIFISHTHPDHVCEIPLFLQLIYLTKREKPIDIYLPDEYIEVLKNLLNANYMPPTKLPFELRFHPHTGDIYQFDDFSVQPIPNTHLKRYETLLKDLNLPNKMECFSFKIKTERSTLFHSADIGSFDDIVGHIDDCKTVIVESSHIDYDDFFKYAQDSKIDQFVITHIADENTPDKLSTEIKKRSLTNIMIAMDGMEIEV